MLAKVVWRYTSLGSILAPLYQVVRVVMKILARFVGYVMGFLFGDESGGAGGAERQRMRVPVSRDARIPKPVWGPVLSLMDDEYL